MDKENIPDLSLLGLRLGPKQQGIDLRRLFYVGAAELYQPNVQGAIDSGKLGRPLLERLPLLAAIHKHWQARLVDKSLSTVTVTGYWGVLRSFVAFVEKQKASLVIETALPLYLQFCAHTSRRADLSPQTKYDYSQVLALTLAPVLGMDSSKLQWKSRIRAARRVGNTGAKENLASTAEFVQLLLETIEQLPASVIRGPIPVTLTYADGHEYAVRCGLRLDQTNEVILDGYSQVRSKQARERRLTDTSNSARSPLINLRMDAEMLVFINQTSCNLTQALQLVGSKFRYRSDGEYLQVYAWKDRAKHDVLLRIYRGYRKQFDSYLDWREELFPDDPDGLTFPFVFNDGAKAFHRTSWAFQNVRALMKSIRQPFVHSRQLRTTVGNFMRRRVSRQKAAELLSNSTRTFRESYEEVNQQSAVAELVSFWSDAEAIAAAVGPGACQLAEPRPQRGAPVDSPSPDCEGAAGCLFCDKNRDIRSFDHVWNLASLHQLKVLEFNADRTPLSGKPRHPVALTIERIAAKLREFERLQGEYEEWVVEANLRVREGRYHPFYTAVFDVLESNQ